MRYGIAGAVLVALVLAGCGGEKTLAEKCDDKVKAYVEGEYAIKPLLKSPSDADFSGVTKTRMVKESQCKWSMVGYVDAKNSFNATTRVPWMAVVEFRESTDAWHPLTAKLIE